jgi:hypothetical protein
MTVRITLRNENAPGTGECRIRRHQRQPNGSIMQDVEPPTLLHPGQTYERSLVASSQGHRDFVVIEPGDGELRYLANVS